MKKVLLFSFLFALLATMPAKGDCVLYIEDFEISNEQRGGEITIPVKAHFDARVSTFTLVLELPYGLTFDGFCPGESSELEFHAIDYSTQYMFPDEWWAQEVDGVTYIYCDAPNVEGYWDPYGEGQYESYGRIKWEAGDYDEMMLLTFLVDDDVRSGTIYMSTKPDSQPDARGGTVVDNGDAGNVFTAETNVSTEMPVTPSPEIVIEEVDFTSIITAVGEGVVHLYIDGEETDNPAYFMSGYEPYPICIEATAQEEGKQISETTVLYYEVPPMPIPWFNVWREMTDDQVIYHIETDGDVVLTVNGDNWQLPEDFYATGTLTFWRGNVDQYYDITIEGYGWGGMQSGFYHDYLVLPAWGSIYDFEQDGIYYKIIGEGQVCVTYRDLEFDCYSGDVVVPAVTTHGGVTYDVVAIRSHAFYDCRNLTSVSLPASLTDIGACAFKSSSLTEVTIPASVKTIGNDAFQIYSGFNRVNITDLAAWCDIDFETGEANPLYYAGHLFMGGEEVTDLIIPDEVTVIKPYSFYYCDGLNSVTIGDAVTKVSESAFFRCEGITSLSLGRSLKTIDAHAFYMCKSLTGVVIADAVETIGTQAFYYCSGMTSLTLGNSLKSIDMLAFSHCTRLTSVSLPNSVEFLSSAFADCTGLTSVSLGNSVKNMQATFARCKNLTSVVIPNSVEVISGTFSGCTGLTHVSFGNSLKSIGHYTFQNCTGLTSFVIPNTVEILGYDVFRNCTNLTSVTIGSSVTKMNTRDFNGCSALATVTCLAMTPPVIFGNTFDTSSNNSATLRVPQASLEAYQQADYWQRFLLMEGIPGPGPGDVNGDGVLNVSDINVLLNALINGELSIEDNPYADLNGDGELDVSDITILINAVLNAD